MSTAAPSNRTGGPWSAAAGLVLLATWAGALGASGEPIASEAEDLLATGPDGVRRELAVDVLSYRFDLELFEHTDEIRGQAWIEVRARRPTKSLTLDLVRMEPGKEASGGLKVDAVRAAVDPPGVTLDRRGWSERPLAGLSFRHHDDLLTIELDPPLLPGDERLVQVLYRGRPGEGLAIGRNRHGDRTFFGDNWPDRARHWLPVVDHPSDKALCAFRVTAPVEYRVIGCGVEVERVDLGDGRASTFWQSTVPMPTKVMVMGAARFSIDRLGVVAGVLVEAWLYPQDREAGLARLGHAVDAQRFFHERVGPFPWAKLAHVQSTTRWGGMENAGNVFYDEAILAGAPRRQLEEADPTAPGATRSPGDASAETEELVAHEIAHQWFGDAVTEEDWLHVWLSEGFATYLSVLWLEERYGEERRIDEMTSSRTKVVAWLREHPEEPVVGSGARELNSLLSTNSYERGGWFLHLLRRELGDRDFWRTLREFYRRHAGGTALTDDLRRVAEGVSGRRLGGLFDAWLERPGVPVVTGSWRRRGRSVWIELRQHGPEPWPLELDVDLVLDNGRSYRRTLRLDDGEQRVRFRLKRRDGSAEVRRVALDPEAWALFQGPLSVPPASSTGR